MASDIAYLIPPGKIRCFITGKLRGDTPEENVRQRWARSLVEEYGYPKADIGVEVTVRMGRARKRTDLAIFTHDTPHRQENIAIVIEAKRDDTLPSDDRDGDGQLLSYMAACPACRFGMWVGGERRAYEKLEARGGGGRQSSRHSPVRGRCSQAPDTRRSGPNPRTEVRLQAVPQLHLRQCWDPECRSFPRASQADLLQNLRRGGKWRRTPVQRRSARAEKHGRPAPVDGGKDRALVSEGAGPLSVHLRRRRQNQAGRACRRLRRPGTAIPVAAEH